MPVPIIAAGISAIGGLVGAKVASGAANKAAEQQVASADKGLGEIQSAYNQMALPSFNALSQLSGLPAVQPLGTLGQAAQPAMPHGPKPPSQQEAAWYAGISGPDGTPRTREPNVPQTKADQLNAGQAQTSSGYRGVQMQAPDGRMVMVPPDKVREAQARGGKVL